jgi:putative addiction module killer protein
VIADLKPKSSRGGSAERRSIGDWRSVGDGVCELRTAYGPGYRVHYGQDGQTLILLCGGDKRR